MVLRCEKGGLHLGGWWGYGYRDTLDIPERRKLRLDPDRRQCISLLTLHCAHSILTMLRVPLWSPLHGPARHMNYE